MVNPNGTSGECRRFEVPAVQAANSTSNFKSKAALESQVF
jgi:hypothetical protein